MNISIERTTPDHVIAIRDNLREADAAEPLCYGISVRKALWRSYKSSVWSRTGLVDGLIGAIWGVCGTAIGQTGTPWLMTSKVVDIVPTRIFLGVCAGQLKEMLQHYPHLENYVDNRYTKAKRLLDIMGFTLHAPAPWGKGIFCKFELHL